MRLKQEIAAKSLAVSAGHINPDKEDEHGFAVWKSYRGAAKTLFTDLENQGFVVVPRKPDENMTFAGGEVSTNPTIPVEVWNAMVEACEVKYD